MEVFLCPYERLSVIHRLPQGGRAKRGNASNFSPLIKPLPPSAGSLTVCKRFPFRCLMGPSRLSDGLIRAEISLIHSFQECLVSTYCSHEGKQRGCTDKAHASQPVGGRASPGTKDVLVIRISKQNSPGL